MLNGVGSESLKSRAEDHSGMPVHRVLDNFEDGTAVTVQIPEMGVWQRSEGATAHCF